MATVRLTARAFSHLESIFEFLAERDPNRALATIGRIREGILILERHPLMGRVVEDGRRELIVSRGRSAHLVLYRWRPAEDVVLVLAVRDARQAGYSPD
jgi:plasmid stabilization system protein ParE